MPRRGHFLVWPPAGISPHGHLACALQARKSVLPQGRPPQNMPFCGAPKGDWTSSAGKARLRRGLAPQGARTRHPARTQPCAISPVPCKPGNPFCRRAAPRKICHFAGPPRAIGLPRQAKPACGEALLRKALGHAIRRGLSPAPSHLFPASQEIRSAAGLRRRRRPRCC